MSTVYSEVKKVCRIGKKIDKSDCAKKDCEHCRHWIEAEVAFDCLKCHEYGDSSALAWVGDKVIKLADLKCKNPNCEFRLKVSL